MVTSLVCVRTIAVTAYLQLNLTVTSLKTNKYVI